MARANRTREQRESEDPSIKFSAKDLFLEINRKIDGLSEQTNKKAEKTEFDVLETQVHEIQRKGSDIAQAALRVAEAAKGKAEQVEREAATNKAVKENADSVARISKTTRLQTWAIIASAAVGIFSVIVQFFHH